MANKAPVGSKWTFKSDEAKRVWVVTDRKPGGVVEYKKDGRARFGHCYLRDFLANAELVSAD